MNTRVAVTCVAVLISPPSLYAAEEATVAVSPYVGIDIGLARIECAAGAGRASRRGALIDTGATVTTYEVVLTAAHGLPDETEAVDSDLLPDRVHGSSVRDRGDLAS